MDSERRIFDGSLDDYEWLDDNGKKIENKEVNAFLENKERNIIREAITKYMPIGSVVRLKNKIGLYMIIGYKYNNNNFKYDYFSAKYPEGLTGNAQFYIFNHDEITKIYHIGMVDGIQREYKKSLLGESEGFNKIL